jgi:ferrochelatase
MAGVKSAVLLVNLGSPDSPSVPDVRRYLREFLMDERVLDSAFPIRWFVVNLMILPKRPKESAHAYQSVWTKEGSPLIVTSQHVQQLLQKELPIPVELAMRYGNPSIAATLESTIAAHGESLREIFLVPLYPHYAMSSYETVVVKVREELARLAPRIALKVLPPFYEEPRYIEALVESARPYFEKPHDLLLFSFHGIPVRHLRKSDPTGEHCKADDTCCLVDSAATPTCYRAQCLRTVKAFVERAGLKPGKWAVSFQSRLGREPWMTPYTDFELERYGKQGVKRILVICPAFVSDCLETLEEIAMRGRDTFLEAGGEEFTLIPCLNEHPMWIKTLAEWCRDALRQ